MARLLAGAALVCFCAGAWGGVLVNEIMYHPVSEDARDEYVEVLNTGTSATNVMSWRLSGGVELVFSNAVTVSSTGFVPVTELWLGPGSTLVLAANITNFAALYPGVTNVVGNWQGHLSNSRERIELVDGAGATVDRVSYADEGDWAIRRRTQPHYFHQGWSWYAEHDGLGKSLELVNTGLPNEYGQNWASSVVPDGTPGSANSRVEVNSAPLVVDTQFMPAVPRSVDAVLVTARVVDEGLTGVTAQLYWRLDGGTTSQFTMVPMLDDGLHDDGLAGDGLFAGQIPPQLNNAVVEFYVSATDLEGQTRTWPAPAIGTNEAPLGQAANALYQVDDSAYGGVFPVYKMVMREGDRAELAAIGSGYGGEQNSDAQMNGTFISVDGTGTVVRPVVGFRNRGHGSRNRKPNNHRVNFSSDRPWKGVTALNLNGQYSHAQLLGSALALKAGLAGSDSRPVQLRVNNANLGNNGPQTYGTMYAANEVMNSDWARHWFPGDSSGNIYRAVRDIAPSEFAWRGSNWVAYTNTWFKESNASENDWSDLVGMMRVMGTNDVYSAGNAGRVAHTEQWLRYVAVMALFESRETGPNTGDNDDYFLYSDAEGRFRMVYYDLDTILGEGSAAGSTNATILGAATNGRPFNLTQFVRSPEFLPRYYWTLQQLLETSFSKREFDLTVDQVLGGFVPSAVVQRIKTWMDGRRAYVQGVIGPVLATNGVPPVARVSGVPRSPTPLRTATLEVGGAGVTHYRYRLNDGGFGMTNEVTTAIVLEGLADGSTNRVFVIGLSTNGLWQAEMEATVCGPWVVNTGWPGVRINEVLARNEGVLLHAGTLPDAIELYNEGPTTADLTGLRLTDRVSSPGKYTFPGGTTLGPGSYLVVYANNADGTPGIHTGFSLDQDGEGVFLFDRASSGGALLDGVEFGLQLPNLSIGRVNGGEFVLTAPTFGTNNTAQAMADVRGLRINEWLASELGTFSTDYVELYNPGGLPAAIGGLYFTDNPIGDAGKSRIAPLSFIGGGGYRVFKADGDTSQGYDHLNFKLAAEQGLIALLTAAGETIDLVQYGPQRTDVAEGRWPDGGDTITSFTTPTPGSRNAGTAAPCTVTSSSVSLMGYNTVWRGNQTTNLDGVNWMASDYDDSKWPSGAGLLAYESDTWITPLLGTTLADPRYAPAGLTPGHAYYFRTTVVITNDLGGHTFNARMRLDDCGVIYINGKEFARPRMGSGVITNSSLGSSATGTNGDATADELFTIPPGWLSLGTNTIAVEVHQSATTSSDIVWGMALDATLTVTNCDERGLVLNEVFARNESFTNELGHASDWVELYNASSNEVVLTDMSLTDDVTKPRKWVFPAGTRLTAGARLVVECDETVAATGSNTGFGLSASGETIYLFRSPAAGGGMADSIAFGLQARDFAVGRIPDGSGGWSLTLPTRASANVPAGLGNASAVRINEWLAEASGGDDWLELYNTNGQPVELSGLTLSDDASARGKSPIPALSFLGPMGHQKLVADGRTGAAADHAGFRLNAAGGFIGLYWPIGTQIDAVQHGAQAADVSEGRFPDGMAFLVAFPGTASPGEANYLLLTNVVISELLSHTDPPLEDAVEIQNRGPGPVDISGWLLSNSGGDLRKYVVPAGTVIGPGEFKVIYEQAFGSGTDGNVPFNFNSAHGDEVHLAQTDALGNATGWRAGAAFGAALNGVSFGRFETSVGEEFVAMSRRTFGVDAPLSLEEFREGTGATNAYPLVGPVVFGEIHYAPTNRFTTNRVSSGEYIELQSVRNDAAVPLYDPQARTNTWKITGGVEFTFPADSRLAPGATLLVVGFDPATDVEELEWFRGVYQVPSTVTIYGPYSGALANEGDEVRLLRPDAPQLPPHPDAGFVPYALVERVRYVGAAPWATNGVGMGAALQRAGVNEFGNEPLNWFTSLPTAGYGSATDRDGDGLPDYWELENGLSPTSAVGTNGAGADVDGDGLSNAEEYLAGTGPRDGQDYLRIEGVSVVAGEVTLRFEAAAGRSFSVLCSDPSPAGPWRALVDVPRAANARRVSVVDEDFDGKHNRFYRIVTKANP